MTTQYTPILKLALPVQGELSGTWGDVVNDNITSMLEEAIAGRAVINSWTTNAHVLSEADGLTSESRAAMLEFTDTGAALTGAATVTCPDASKIYICKNSSGQQVTVTTAAGTGVDIPNGTTMIVFCDETNVNEVVTNVNSLSYQGYTVEFGGNVSTAGAFTTSGAYSLTLTTTGTTNVTLPTTGTLATLDGSETFTNKTFTSPTISSPTLTGSITATDLDISGNTTIGDDAADTLTITATITSDMLFTDDTYDIGASGANRPRSIYLSQDLTVGDAATITGNAEVGGDFAVTGSVAINTDKFQIEGTSGNTLVAGTLGVTGNVSTDGAIATDAIAEKTATAGVTVDGLLVKDSSIGRADASGTDIAGSQTTVKGGASTGTGAGGSIVFQTTPASETSGTDVNAQVTAMTISGEGDVTLTGDLNFGDNDKAVFGAGSDLQIYHDGTTNKMVGSIDITGSVTCDSHIDIETSSGFAYLEMGGPSGAYIDLKSPFSDDYDGRLQFNGTDVLLQVSSTAATAGGAVKLYHGSSSKLATTSTGIDVTGTATMDGLTVDATPSNNLVINSTTTNNALDLRRSNWYSGDKYRLQLYGADTDPSISIEYYDDSAATQKQRFSIDGDGDISFYEDTGTTAKFFWDASAEALGIGTSTPESNARLTVRHTDAFNMVAMGNNIEALAPGTNNGGAVYFGVNASDTDQPTAAIEASWGGGNFPQLHMGLSRGGNKTRYSAFFDSSLRMYTADAERMRITSSGNVGIGTSSPTTTLDVVGTVTADGLTLANATYIKLNDSASAAPRVLGINASNVTYIGPIDSYAGGGINYGISANVSTHQFYTGGTERMRIDSAGNVGIGTASPTGSLTVSGDVKSYNNFNDTREIACRLSADASIDGVMTVPHLDMRRWTGGATTHGCSAIAGYNDGSMRFYTDYKSTNTVATTERMRIASNGSVLIGTTDSVVYDNNSDTTDDDGIAFQSYGKIEVCRYASLAAEFNRTGSNGLLISFRRSGIGVGSISVTTSATAYNTSSDYRLKTDVQPMANSIDRVKQLKPVNFEWISSGERVDGFIAHEAQEVVPEAVTGTKDAMRTEEYEVTPALGEIYTPAQEATYDDEGNEVTPAVDEVIHSTNVEQPEQLAEGQYWRETTAAVMGTREVPDYQGIDQSKLVPLLTAALQEAVTRIETLEAKVAVLEGANA